MKKRRIYLKLDFRKILKEIATLKRNFKKKLQS